MLLQEHLRADQHRRYHDLRLLPEHRSRGGGGESRVTLDKIRSDASDESVMKYFGAISFSTLYS